MKRLGERATYISPLPNFNAWQNPRITTSPQLFYDRILGAYIFYSFNVFVTLPSNNLSFDQKASQIIREHFPLVLILYYDLYPEFLYSGGFRLHLIGP